MYKSMYPALVAMVLFWGAKVAHADDVADEFISSQMGTTTIKSFGMMAFLWRGNDATLEKDRQEVMTHYWAFAPDAGLSPDELAAQTRVFDAHWKAFIDTSRAYKIEKVWFIGLNTVFLTQAMDLYMASATPRGMVLVKFSVLFHVGESARVMNIETITDWEKIRVITSTLQHPVSPTRVPNITIDVKPPTTKPSV